MLKVSQRTQAHWKAYTLLALLGVGLATVSAVIFWKQKAEITR
ncbi:MAG TPA: hypothetical protein VKC60_16875 [Opitutaceae bacterium]|nr:hypothetical protein [Opitutaceae bacterium]